MLKLACEHLNLLLEKKLELFGDFHLKTNSTYKMLCSVFLKKNDMQNGAKYLQKSIECEELNYGKNDKRTLASKQTLENLKKYSFLKSIFRRNNFV